MLEERDGSDVDHGRAGASEQAALIEQLSAIREELLEVAEGWRPWIEGGRRTGTRARATCCSTWRCAGMTCVISGPADRARAVLLGRQRGPCPGQRRRRAGALRALCASIRRRQRLRAAPIGFAHSRELLALRTEALLGPAPRRRPTRIMVTMPTEAASDPDLVREMLRPGWTACGSTAPTTPRRSGARCCENLRLAEEQTAASSACRG